MFEAFLSPDMTYSCPIWLPKSDLRSEFETLEQAQVRKLRRFITNAKIKEGDHVLEIGTGWGSFAIQAVRETGCRVTSLTLSKEQKLLAEERIAEAGFTDNIEILLCDYRALPIPKDGGLYDKVVSIEMLEAVGKEFLATYFECIDKLLKKDGGIAVFQCITIPENVSLYTPRALFLDPRNAATDVPHSATKPTPIRTTLSAATYSLAVISQISPNSSTASVTDPRTILFPNLSRTLVPTTPKPCGYGTKTSWPTLTPR